MEFKLTQRDKKLLVAVGVILIIFVFVFLLILPALDRGEELTAQIEEAETFQNTMATAIASYPTKQITYEEMRSAGDEAMKDYYPMMSTQEIDKEVTGIVVSLGGQVNNLDIMIEEEAPQLEPYYASSLSVTENTSDTQETGASDEVDIDDLDEAESLANQEASGQVNQEDNSEGVTASTLRGVNVRMTAQGDRGVMENLVDYFFNNCPGILINSYSYGETEVNEVKIPSVYIDMELYMCDKEN